MAAEFKPTQLMIKTSLGMSSAPLRFFRWLYVFIVGHFQRFIISVLAAGPIPKHIAIVMDGNRRYAGKLGKPPIEGHIEGFSALRRVSNIFSHGHVCVLKEYQVLELSFRLGVRCVSVYAFAIDNFRRSPEEVAALMNMFEEKLCSLSQNGYVQVITSVWWLILYTEMCSKNMVSVLIF